MSNYEKFVEKFKETVFRDGYGESEKGSIVHFIGDFEDGRNSLNLELMKNDDIISHDSYGSEDSTLKRVFYSPEFDIYVEFSGTRQSYNGEEWTEMREVKPVTKTVTVYTYE